MMTKSSDQQGTAVVYVVDDDDGMRRALDTLLSTDGFTTGVFSRPGEFLANFRSRTATAPQSNGLDAADHIHHSHGDVPMAVQAMKEGGFEFLQKPFRDQDLLDRINHALKHDAENRSTVALRADVQHRLQSLTPRDRQVMDMVVDGAANKVIVFDRAPREAALDAGRKIPLELG